VKQSVSLAILTAFGVGSFFVRAQGPASTRDGVYSDSQAARGRAAYKTACSSCHGDNLQGSGAAMPPLAGDDFTGNWAGQTVDDLFERIQTSMPADHPGSLSRAVNADIVAYLLKTNKLPAGKTDLPSEAEPLKRIRFEAAK
jgi:mono/diheme cytochrome c family protein